MILDNNKVIADIKLLEQIYNWIREQNSVGILFTDTSLMITFYSKWFENTCKGRSDYVNVHLFEAFPEIRERGLDRNYFNALSGIPSVLSNKLHKYLIKIPIDDREHNIEFMQQVAEIFPLYSDGKIIGTVTRIEDVTERTIREKELSTLINQLIKSKNQIQAEEEKYRTLTENIPDTIVRLDRNFRYTFLNKKVIGATGINAEDFIGKTIEELNFFPEDIIEKCNRNVEEVFTTGEHRSFEYSLNIQNKTKYYEIRFIPEKNPITKEIDSVVEINRDITEIVEIRNKLKEYTNQLEKLNETKNKFFSILAHDLRSPFFPLLNISEYLVEDFEKLSNDEIKEGILDLRTVIQNLYTLIENLLSWAQFERGGMIFNHMKLNLNNLIGSVVSLYKKNSESKGINLITHFDGEIIFDGDENQIKTLMRNLVSNAIKFTSSGKSITITTHKYDSFFEIRVKDEGIGIDEKTRDKLFKLSEVKSQKGTAGESGTGLGLILCKEIVTKHKGEIEVESEIGKGTTIICKMGYEL